MKELARELVDKMPQLTARKGLETLLANAKRNLPSIKKTIDDLPPDESGARSAIAMGAGPSLYRQDTVGQIINSDYRGPVIAADGALGHCLRAGLVPDYVISLDPGPIATGPDRMLRWFGDPGLTLEKLDQDDYFRRQDLDPYLGERELERNKEMVTLVDRHGGSMKAIMATSIPPVLAERVLQTGMEIYWWNPLLDDFSDPSSVTAQLYRLNKVPCMVSGGNCGAAAWVFAHAVLGKQEVAIAGMDFSYAPDTPLRNTQYYKEFEEIFGDKAPEAFIDVYNPHSGETWFTDPTYYWYRQSFLDMAEQAGCVTFNCTEGGILFGKGVQVISLEQFFDAQGSIGAVDKAKGGLLG